MTSVLYIKVVFTVVNMDSTSLCTKGVKSLFTTQRNGFSFNNKSRKKLNNQARCGTKINDISVSTETKLLLSFTYWFKSFSFD